MKLVRTDHRFDGVFGRLYNDHGVPIAYSLEHSYVDLDGVCSSKIPNGQYVCVRGIHQLHNGVPFETFEVTGVPHCTGILFHAGNFDKDSEGCILLGNGVVTQDDGIEMVVNSKHTFNDFMSSLHDIKEFILTVQ